MRRTSLTAILLMTALVGKLPSPAAAAGDDKATTIDALVREAGIAGDGPGVAILVRGTKGVLFRKGYGVADVEQKTRIEPETTFELASVSKQFTGIATLLLVERGKISMDDDVRKHLPELPRYDERHPITLGDLSRHTSGMPDYLSFEGVKGQHSDYLTNADFVPEFARRLKEFPLVFATGAKYDYSNTGYMLLGAVVERVSGLSYGAFLAREVFGPLGMKTAWVNESPDARPRNPATGYRKERNRWSPSWSAPTAKRHEQLLTTGDGGVWASLDDMAAWDAGLRDGKPVKATTLAAALVPQKARDGKTIAYGVGWSVKYGKGDQIDAMWHDGSWSGFETYIVRALGSGITVVVLSNRGGFDAESLGNSVAALFEKDAAK